MLDTIINGDCIHVLSRLASLSINFILTDPPYIVNYRGRDGRSIKNDDNAAWLKPAFAEMYRVLARNSFCVSFYGWGKVDQFVAAWKSAGFRIIGHLTFPKRYTSSSGFLRYQHECAYLLAKGYPSQPEYTIGDVIDWTYSGNKHHPTEKPISALLPLVETFSKPQDTVLDPFAGSGSSLVAARQLSRHFLGIELDPQYHAIASKRLGVVT